MTTSSSARAWRRAVLLAAVALGACSSMPGMSPTLPLKARIDAAQEVPTNPSTGTGTLEATLDKNTNVLKYKVVYSGLTGPATAAHFHGPATIGQNAGVVLPFKSPASPIEGEATLTPAQAADLSAGKWYVNIHTARNPAGEIRGQVMVGK